MAYDLPGSTFSYSKKMQGEQVGGEGGQFRSILSQDSLTKADMENTQKRSIARICVIWKKKKQQMAATETH